MKLKQIVLILLALIIILSLCACGTKANVDTPNSEIAERDKAIEEAVKRRQEQIAAQKANSTPTPAPTPASKGSLFYEISDTEIAYNEAKDISAKDCEKTSNDYKSNLKYKSKAFPDAVTIIIHKEDLNYFALNSFFVSDQALYNSWTFHAAQIIDDWKNEKTSETYIVEATVGTVPGESRTSRLERLNSFVELMPYDIGEMELLKVLETNGVLSNYKNTGSIIVYDINDLRGAAEKLGITERMLGYVVAYIGGTSEHSRIAQFADNSVHVEITKI